MSTIKTVQECDQSKYRDRCEALLNAGYHIVSAGYTPRIVHLYDQNGWNAKDWENSGWWAVLVKEDANETQRRS